jgi:hypothetical protein
MTDLVGPVVLIMVSQPALGLFIVLAVLEGVVDDDSEVISVTSLALERVEVALLDKDDALLVT